MIIIFALLQLFVHITSCLSVQDNSVLSWTNERGQAENLVIYQMQYFKQMDLVQIYQLPNDFIIEQFNNCNIIFSNQYSQIYATIQQNYYTFNYIYQVNQTVVDKGVLKIFDGEIFELDLVNSTISINISTPSIIIQNSTNNNSTNSSLLYMYNQNLLYSFNSAVYSSNPTCYKLSQMTQDLCNIQQCQTLSPNNLIQNQALVTQIDNFQIQNGKIFIVFNQPIINDTFQFDFSNSNKNDSNFIFQINQTRLNFDSKIKISINVLNSQASGNLQRILVESSPQIGSSSTTTSTSNSISLKVNLQNTQSTEQYGLVQISLNNVNVYEKQSFFSPYQTISISLTMASDSIMQVLLYDINHNLKSNYKFSIDTVILIQNIIPQQTIISSSTILQKGSIVGIIIAAIIVGIAIIVLVKFYKKYKWCQKVIESEMEKNNQQNQNKESKESGRELKLEGLNSLQTLPSNQILIFDNNGEILVKQNKKISTNNKNSQNPEQKALPQSSTQQSQKAQTI